MPLPTWLPAISIFSGSDWHSYEDHIYSFFTNDFINSHPNILGKPVYYKKEPIENGKVATFWHLTTEGSEESSRNPDLRRCERVCWLKPIIQNHNDPNVKCWRNQRKKHQKRLCLMLDCENECFLIILTETPKFFVLLTSYKIETQYKKDKLIREYEANRL